MQCSVYLIFVHYFFVYLFLVFIKQVARPQISSYLYALENTLLKKRFKGTTRFFLVKQKERRVVFFIDLRVNYINATATSPIQRNATPTSLFGKIPLKLCIALIDAIM